MENHQIFNGGYPGPLVAILNCLDAKSLVLFAAGSNTMLSEMIFHSEETNITWKNLFFRDFGVDHFFFEEAISNNHWSIGYRFALTKYPEIFPGTDHIVRIGSFYFGALNVQIIQNLGEGEDNLHANHYEAILEEINIKPGIYHIDLQNHDQEAGSTMIRVHHMDTFVSEDDLDQRIVPGGYKNFEMVSGDPSVLETWIHEIPVMNEAELEWVRPMLGVKTCKNEYGAMIHHNLLPFRTYQFTLACLNDVENPKETLAINIIYNINFASQGVPLVPLDIAAVLLRDDSP